MDLLTLNTDPVLSAARPSSRLSVPPALLHCLLSPFLYLLRLFLHVTAPRAVQIRRTVSRLLLCRNIFHLSHNMDHLHLIFAISTLTRRLSLRILRILPGLTRLGPIVNLLTMQHMQCPHQ